MIKHGYLKHGYLNIKRWLLSNHLLIFIIFLGLLIIIFQSTVIYNLIFSPDDDVVTYEISINSKVSSNHALSLSQEENN